MVMQQSTNTARKRAAQRKISNVDLAEVSVSSIKQLKQLSQIQIDNKGRNVSIASDSRLLSELKPRSTKNSKWQISGPSSPKSTKHPAAKKLDTNIAQAFKKDEA